MSEKETVSFASKVDELVSKAEKTENGLILTDDILKDVPEEVADAATRELRFRNTQSKYTKTSQDAKKYAKMNEKLTEHLIQTATAHITPAQQKELDKLKLSDPDKYIEKVNAYELEAKTILQQKLDEAKAAGESISEEEARKLQLEAFVEQSGIQLTDEIIANELPPGFAKQLEEGKITFDQFLTKAGEWLTKQKVIQGTGKTDKELKEEENLDLRKASGSKQPSEDAKEGDIVESYRTEVY